MLFTFICFFGFIAFVVVGKSFFARYMKRLLAARVKPLVEFCDAHNLTHALESELYVKDETFWTMLISTYIEFAVYSQQKEESVEGNPAVIRLYCRFLKDFPRLILGRGYGMKYFWTKNGTYHRDDGKPARVVGMMRTISTQPNVRKLVVEDFFENAMHHRDTGPAHINYKNHKKDKWCINNREVPQYVVETPEKITLDNIIGEQNQEIRAIMWARADKNKIFDVAGDERISVIDTQDPSSATKEIKLFKVAGLRIPVGTNEEFVAMLMTNSTPEPDGSYKKYITRVPPQTSRVHDALAWSYDVPEYAPLVQT